MVLRSVVSRNLVLLSVVSLLTDFSTEMVFPLLPFFLATLGGGAVAVGLMEGTADSIAAFLRYASGRLSDRTGSRKGLTMLGYTFSSLVKLLYAAASTVSHVILIRGTDRIGKGLRDAPRDALIAESVPRAYWGFAYGFHRMMDTSGALIGPLAALLLIGAIGSSSSALRTLFLIAAGPGLVGALLLSFVQEPGRAHVRISEKSPLLPKEAFHGPMARYLMVTALFTLGNLSLAFLILRATQLGLSLTTIILLYTCFNATYAVAALPLGSWTDRMGRPLFLTIAYTVFGLTAGLVVITNPSSTLGLLPFFVLTGVAKALKEGNGRAFVADLAPSHLRATGFGAYHATIGALALPAGLLAGGLWHFDYRWTFFASQIFCSAALLLFLVSWFTGRLRRRE